MTRELIPRLYSAFDWICFRMTSYVDNVKKNVVGQGILHELGIGVNTSKYDLEDDLYDLPPPLPSSHLPGPHISSSSPLPLPPPPMDLLNLDTLLMIRSILFKL